MQNPAARLSIWKLLLSVSFLALLSGGSSAENAETPPPPPPADQTQHIQKLLDDVAARGGGEVKLDARQYIVKGTLNVPTGVMLSGAWEMPHHGILDKGTVLLAYAGRGREDGAPLITLNQSSGVRGLTVCYPEQKITDIQPYPWTIIGRGMHNTVENVTLVNSYQGICIGEPAGELHLIRNVFGCVLRRGLQITNCTDIGRIENVHFNPHYWPRSGHDGAAVDGKMNTEMTIAAYTQEHLEAFIFGRSDWEYVANTFVFGAKIGYHFIATQSGAANGQLLGIGADACRYCVVVDDMQPISILITNGEFVCLELIGTPRERVGIVAGARFGGSLQLSNCSFWGNFTSHARIAGNGFFSLSQARLAGNSGPSIELLSGRAAVTNCIFESKSLPHIKIEPEVQRAAIMANFAPGGVKIENHAGQRLWTQGNE